MATESTFHPKGRVHKATCVRFDDGLADMAQWFADCRAKGRRVIPSGFGLTPQAEKRLHTGDDSLVAKSDAMLARIEAASPLDNCTHESIRTVAGSFADIPAYLSGSPVAMRRRQRKEAVAPLTVVIDVTSSGGMGKEVLERRGVAALSLLRKLEAAGHAIELWVCAGIGDSGKTSFAFTRLDTRPMDLSRACWALCSHEFSRQCSYAALNTTGNGSYNIWPWADVKWHGYPEAQREAYAMALGLDPASVLALPPIHLNHDTGSFKSEETAIAWVNDKYAQAVSNLNKEE